MLVSKNCRYLSVIICILIISLLSGCDYGKPPVEEKVRTEISLVYPRDGGGGIMRLLTEYEQLRDDVSIKAFEAAGEKQGYYERLTAVISAGQKMPDILVIHDTWMPELAEKGILKQLDGILGSDSLSDFHPGMAEAGRWKGKLFAIPFWQDMPLLYYRKDLIDTPLNTWKKLEDAAADLKSQLEIPYGLIFPAESQWNSTVFMTSLLIAYDAMPDFSGQAVSYNEKAISSAFGRLKSLAEKDVLSSDVFNMGAEKCRQVFSEGNAVFMINWSYAARLLIKDDSPLKDRVASAPIPMAGSDDTYSGLISGWMLTIGSQSKHTALAREVVEYLIRHDNQRRIALDNGQLPARVSLYEEKGWQDRLHVPEVLSSLLPAGQPAMLGIYSEDLMGQLNSILSKVFDTETKTSDLLKMLIER